MKRGTYRKSAPGGALADMRCRRHRGRPRQWRVPGGSAKGAASGQGAAAAKGAAGQRRTPVARRLGKGACLRGATGVSYTNNK